MKKVFAILGLLLIVTGLKAQKSNAQKETVKPVADTLIKNSAVKNTAVSKDQKEAKIAPALKYAPAAIKKAPAAGKEFKNASPRQ
ncbi:MAG: hypothetical protein JST39_06230 [Bacteroidetes bacterium]|nr:hypothetical protein [Bacteroidota bacterium]